MATIKEMREQAAKVVTEAREMLDGINDKSTPEQRAEAEQAVDRALDEASAIEARAERLQKLEGAEKRAAEQAEAEERAKRDAKRPGSEAGEARQGGDMTYRDAFHAYLRAQGSVGDMEAEARSVLRAGYSAIESRAQTTTNSAGGYTVPTEMASFIVKSLAMWGPMYDPGITTEMMTSGGGQITIPTVNDTSTAVVQHSEGVTLTDDGGADATFGQKTLDAYAYNTEWLRVSKELVDDSAFNIEQFLGELLGERLARRVNTELTTGDGTGDPNGIVTASAAGKTAAATGAFTADELIDLLHSVDPAYRMSPRTRWMMNDTTLSALRKLKYGDGTYIVQRDFQNGLEERLLGYPISVNQAMVNAATGTKPIIFGDFSKYIVRKVGQPMIGAIQDKDFWPGFGIAGYVRLDGDLVDTAAVKHLVMA